MGTPNKATGSPIKIGYIGDGQSASIDNTDELLAAGLDSAAFSGRSFYDAVLDTTALLGLLPERVADIADHDNDGLPRFIDRYFAAARAPVFGAKKLSAFHFGAKSALAISRAMR